jgi:prevent-host-death family protein
LTVEAIGGLLVAMMRVSIGELKSRLSAHLRAVERGDEVEVSRHNRPIARIVPVCASDHQLRVFPAVRPFRLLRRRRYPPAGWPTDSGTLLREERGWL